MLHCIALHCVQCMCITSCYLVQSIHACECRGRGAVVANTENLPYYEIIMHKRKIVISVYINCYTYIYNTNALYVSHSIFAHFSFSLSLSLSNSFASLSRSPKCNT